MDAIRDNPQYFTLNVLKYAKSGEPLDRDVAISSLARITPMNRDQAAIFCEQARSMFISLGATDQKPPTRPK